jgi:hypothetical protein
MSESTTVYGGACHCGALGFSLRATQPPARWIVRACQCRFCRAHGALSCSDPDGSLEFHASDRAAVSRYRFGHRTADFLVCSRCGVYVGAILETPRGRFGIVNVLALQPMPPGLPAAVAMDYEDEAVDQRRARREERWSPVTAEP